MRSTFRAIAVTAIVAVAAVIPAAPAQASGTTVFTALDSSAYEYQWSCSTGSPYPCTTFGTVLNFEITVTNPAHQAMNIGWKLTDITTTAGADYTGPTSGVATVPANGFQTFVTVPVVNDGVAESTETVRFSMTSSNVPANYSDTATGTITNAAQLPADCTPSKSNQYTEQMACTGRPAGQVWHMTAACMAFGRVDTIIGNNVTGNGTSGGVCGEGYASTPYFVLN